MKWVKRIIGFLLAIQCIGFYSAAINNFNLDLLKSIAMAILETVFLIIGVCIIILTFSARKPTTGENVKE